LVVVAVELGEALEQVGVMVMVLVKVKVMCGDPAAGESSLEI
jgi:hypothetical protein